MPEAKHFIVGDLNIYYPVWEDLSIKIDSKKKWIFKIIDHYYIKLIIEEGVSI
jgi:hypothetical protein